MKDIPIKRNRKTAIFSLSWGAWSSPYVTLSSLHLTTTLHIHPPFHPLLSSLLCNMSVCYVALCFICVDCFAWPSLCCGQWENSSQTPLFTLAAVGCHIPSLRLLASFFLHFSAVELLLYSWLLAAVPLQLCLCCHDVQVSWDRAVYGKHITKGTVPGQSDILPLLNKNFKLLQASGLHSYRPAFSFVVVTWYFMGPSFVFTETTRLYS